MVQYRGSEENNNIGSCAVCCNAVSDVVSLFMFIFVLFHAV